MTWLVRLQEAISQKPCENPYQMTDEQLETELMNRGKQSQGTREDMIKALTTLDNCKLTKIFMLPPPPTHPCQLLKVLWVYPSVGGSVFMPTFPARYLLALCILETPKGYFGKQ